ncbi:mucin-19 [Danio aesculapii]|uniref:mucin-19 n=1 Tax=Danio aesculapii TaxID=1142201 RepID=UPI0024BFE5BF|nr:mucin-19 [Danio aesculapii]
MAESPPERSPGVLSRIGSWLSWGWGSPAATAEEPETQHQEEDLSETTHQTAQTAEPADRSPSPNRNDRHLRSARGSVQHIKTSQNTELGRAAKKKRRSKSSESHKTSTSPRDLMGRRRSGRRRRSSHGEKGGAENKSTNRKDATTGLTGSAQTVWADSVFGEEEKSVQDSPGAGPDMDEEGVVRLTESPESKRRSIKVSHSQKVFPKKVVLDPETQHQDVFNKETASGGSRWARLDERARVDGPSVKSSHPKGKIADKINLFERGATNAVSSSTNLRRLDISPARKMPSHLKDFTVQAGGRSSSAPPKQSVKERARNFNTGGTDEKIPLPSGHTLNEGALKKAAHFNKSTTGGPKFKSKPHLNIDQTDSKSHDATQTKLAQPESKTDLKFGNKDADKESCSQETVLMSTDEVKLTTRTGTRSKKRRNKDMGQPQSPTSQNKQDTGEQNNKNSTESDMASKPLSKTKDLTKSTSAKEEEEIASKRPKVPSKLEKEAVVTTASNGQPPTSRSQSERRTVVMDIEPKTEKQQNNGNKKQPVEESSEEGGLRNRDMIVNTLFGESGKSDPSGTKEKKPLSPEDLKEASAKDFFEPAKCRVAASWNDAMRSRESETDMLDLPEKDTIMCMPKGKNTSENHPQSDKSQTPSVSKDALIEPSNEKQQKNNETESTATHKHCNEVNTSKPTEQKADGGIKSKTTKQAKSKDSSAVRPNDARQEDTTIVEILNTETISSNALLDQIKKEKHTSTCRALAKTPHLSKTTYQNQTDSIISAQITPTEREGVVEIQSGIKDVQKTSSRRDLQKQKEKPNTEFEGGAENKTKNKPACTEKTFIVNGDMHSIKTEDQLSASLEQGNIPCSSNENAVMPPNIGNLSSTANEVSTKQITEKCTSNSALSSINNNTPIPSDSANIKTPPLGTTSTIDKTTLKKSTPIDENRSPQASTNETISTSSSLTNENTIPPPADINKPSQASANEKNKIPLETTNKNTSSEKTTSLPVSANEISSTYPAPSNENTQSTSSTETVTSSVGSTGVKSKLNSANEKTTSSQALTNEQATPPPTSTTENTTHPPTITIKETTPLPALTNEKSTPPPALTNEKTIPPQALTNQQATPPQVSTNEKTAHLPVSTNEKTTHPAVSNNEKTAPPPASTNEKTTPPPASTNEKATPPPASTNEKTSPPPASTNEKTTPPPVSTNEKATPPPVSTNKKTTRPPVSNNEKTASPPASTNKKATPPPVSTNEKTTPPPVSTNEKTTPPSVSNNEITTPPPASTNEKTAPPPASTNETTTPPPASTNEKTTPPPVSTNEKTTPPPVSTNKKTTCPPVSNNEKTASPPASTNEKATPPPVSTNEKTTPPPVSTNEKTTPPSVSDNEIITPPPASTNEKTAPPPVSTNEKTAPPPASTNETTTPPPASTNEKTTPPPVSTNENTTPPPASTNEKTTSPPASTNEKTPPPPVSTNEKTTPPPVSTNKKTTPPPVSTNEKTTPPPVSTNEKNTPPPVSTNEKTTPPPVSKNEKTTPPPVSTNEKTTPPPVSTNEKTTPPPVSTNEKTTPPPASTNEKTTPPPVSTNEKTTPPPVSTNEKTTPPPASTNEKTAPPPASTNKKTAPPPASTNEKTAPPPTSTNEKTAPPPASTNEKTTPPPASTNEKTTPPPVSTNEKTTPPPVSTNEKTTPPPASTNEKTAPPPASTNEKTAPPPASTNEKTAPPPTSTNEKTAPPPASTNKKTTPPPASTSEKTAPPPASTNEKTAPPPVSTNEKTTPPPALTNENTTPPLSSTNEKTTAPPALTNENTTPPLSSTNEKTTPPPASTNKKTTPPPVSTNENTTPPPVLTNEKTTPPLSSTNEKTKSPPALTNEKITPPPASTNKKSAPPPASTNEKTTPLQDSTNEKTTPLQVVIKEKATPPSASTKEKTTPSPVSTNENTTPLPSSTNENTPPPPASTNEKTASLLASTSKKSTPAPTSTIEKTISPPASTNEKTSPSLSSTTESNSTLLDTSHEKTTPLSILTNETTSLDIASGNTTKVETKVEETKSSPTPVNEKPTPGKTSAKENAAPTPATNPPFSNDMTNNNEKTIPLPASSSIPLASTEMENIAPLSLSKEKTLSLADYDNEKIPPSVPSVAEKTIPFQSLDKDKISHTLASGSEKSQSPASKSTDPATRKKEFISKPFILPQIPFAPGSSSVHRDSPSSWLDVDHQRPLRKKQLLPEPKHKLSSSVSETKLDTSGEFDSDDFIANVKRLAMPFSLPQRKHNQHRLQAPPFAMPAIREDHFEKPFDPEEFQHGLKRRRGFILDMAPDSVTKSPDTEVKNVEIKPKRESILTRSLIFQRNRKESDKEEEEKDEGSNEITTEPQTRSRLERCSIVSMLRSPSKARRTEFLSPAESASNRLLSPSDTSGSSTPIQSQLTPTTETHEQNAVEQALGCKDYLSTQPASHDFLKSSKDVVVKATSRDPSAIAITDINTFPAPSGTHATSQVALKSTNNDRLLKMPDSKTSLADSPVTILTDTNASCNQSGPQAVQKPTKGDTPAMSPGSKMTSGDTKLTVLADRNDSSSPSVTHPDSQVVLEPTKSDGHLQMPESKKLNKDNTPALMPAPKTTSGDTKDSLLSSSQSALKVTKDYGPTLTPELKRADPPVTILTDTNSPLLNGIQTSSNVVLQPDSPTLILEQKTTPAVPSVTTAENANAPPPLPSFEDIKLPSYLDKFLPKEPGKDLPSNKIDSLAAQESASIPGLVDLKKSDIADRKISEVPPAPQVPQISQAEPQRELPNIPTSRGLHRRPGKIVIYEHHQFNGQSFEFYRDQPDATHMHLSTVISIKVVRGCWILYEKPGFEGRSIPLEEEGVIELPNQWAEEGEEVSAPVVIGSIRLAVRDYATPRIELFTEPAGRGHSSEFVDHAEEVSSFGRPQSTGSIKVHSGLWLVYSDPGFQGLLAVLEAGEYPFPEDWGFPAPAVGSLRPLRMGCLKVEKPNTVKAVLYEKSGFKGRCVEVQRDVFSCTETDTNNAENHGLNGVESLKILGGLWVGYEHEGFDGQQFILEEGEYLDWSDWCGTSQKLLSLRPLLMDSSPPRVKMFSELDFSERGVSIDLLEPLENFANTHYGTQTRSIEVLAGVWLAFEAPGFSGQQYVLEKGLYGAPEDWGASDSRICSVIPVMVEHVESCCHFQMELFSECDCRGASVLLEDSLPIMPQGFSARSCRVLSGSWQVFAAQSFSGVQCVLDEGVYPDLRTMGFTQLNTAVQSVQPTGHEFSVPSVALFERCGLRGRRTLLKCSSVNLQLTDSCTRVCSVLVEGGMWVLYEANNFRGSQILLKPGAIPDWHKFSSWQRIGSLRPLIQKQMYFRLRNKESGLLMSVTGSPEDVKLMRIQVTEEAGGDHQIWTYQDGHLQCKCVPECVVDSASAVLLSGCRVVLSSEVSRSQQQLWNITSDGFIRNSSSPQLVLEVKGGQQFDKKQIIINEFHPNKPSQRWSVEIL